MYGSSAWTKTCGHFIVVAVVESYNSTFPRSKYRELNEIVDFVEMLLSYR